MPDVWKQELVYPPKGRRKEGINAKRNRFMIVNKTFLRGVNRNLKRYTNAD